jgi:hypothetical protein
MIKAFDYLFYDLQCFGIMLSFLFSLRLVNKKVSPTYMKLFKWYSIIGAAVMIPTVLDLHFFKKGYTYYIINFSLLFHYLFLAYFIFKLVIKEKIGIFLTLIFFSILIFILYLLFSSKLSDQNFQAFTIANLGVVIFCIFYYFKLFQDRPVLDLLNEPSYWIITGIFFCMCISIPISGIIGYMKTTIPLDINWVFLYHITTLSYFIMHMFFIKAYLCTTCQTKV